MTFGQLLKSLSNDELNFIAGLDNDNDQAKHRSALDAVIEDDGLIDLGNIGNHFPYKTINNGTRLQVGHEREYAACMGIILRNIETGDDERNDLEDIINTQSDSIRNLPDDLREGITFLINRMLDWN